MRKKKILISIAILTLVTFGSVSSAQAFVDPVSISIALGIGFFTLVSASEGIKNTDTATAQKQTKELESKQKLSNSTEKPNWVTQTTVHPAR